MFAGKWDYIMTETENMKSHHLVENFRINHATPLFAMAVVSLFMILLQKGIPDMILQKLGFTLNSQDIIVDEDLPNFYTSIKLKQADQIILESDNIRTNYGLEIEDP